MAGLVAITPAAGNVGIPGAFVIGTVAGSAVMMEAMSSMAFAEEAGYSGPPKLSGDVKGATVLILGSGLAGMVSAYELRKAGYKVQILEYQNRPGGRNISFYGGDTYTELGGFKQDIKFDKGLYMNPGPWRIPYHHQGILHYCKMLGVQLETFNQANYNAYVHSTRAFGGKPQRFRHIQADYQGYVAELLSKAIDQKSLDTKLTAEDQDKFREALRTWGMLDEDMKYAKNLRSSSHRGFELPPDGVDLEHLGARSAPQVLFVGGLDSGEADGRVGLVGLHHAVRVGARSGGVELLLGDAPDVAEHVRGQLPVRVLAHRPLGDRHAGDADTPRQRHHRRHRPPLCRGRDRPRQLAAPARRAGGFGRSALRCRSLRTLDAIIDLWAHKGDLGRAAKAAAHGLTGLLRRSGITETALNRLQAGPNWQELNALPLHRALAETSRLLRSQAEAVPCGPIHDMAFLDWIEANLPALLAREPAALAHAVRRSCEIKAHVVGQDERESGLRAILNFGHTFGHAIEAGLGYGEWLHGEAVGCGMVMAADLSVRLGWLEADAAARAKTLLQRAGLPVAPPAGMGADDFMRLMAFDKKVQGGKIRFILLRGLGKAVIESGVDATLLQQTLEAGESLCQR